MHVRVLVFERRRRFGSRRGQRSGTFIVEVDRYVTGAGPRTHDRIRGGEEGVTWTVGSDR